jgi:hypothetical protein
VKDKGGTINVHRAAIAIGSQHEADYVFTDSNSVEFHGITAADGIDDPAHKPIEFDRFGRPAGFGGLESISTFRATQCQVNASPKERGVGK